MITVLTPTYNRAHTLLRVYESLSIQTDARFEWLVIDDGSTDNTHDMLKTLRSEARFRMHVLYQPNSGKHVAINAGSRAALCDWILILDSDDALMPHAVETINEEIEKKSSQDILGLCFRKAFFKGGLVGEENVPEPPLFLHPTKAGSIFKGDLAYIFRKSSLLLHPFPVIQGETFFPELFIWNKIGDDGKILFFPKTAIYLCEYLEDGYSMNLASHMKRNPRGFFTYYRSQLFREGTILRKLKCFIRSVQCLFYVVWKSARR